MFIHKYAPVYFSVGVVNFIIDYFVLSFFFLLHYFYAVLHYVIKSFFFLCFEVFVLFQDSVFLFIFV